MAFYLCHLGCEITAKAEHLNPGGSVKDRAALYLIKEAEEKGQLCKQMSLTTFLVGKCQATENNDFVSII